MHASLCVSHSSGASPGTPKLLKAQLKSNVDELRRAEKGKARTYQAGYAEGLKLAERKHAQQQGFLQGLKEGIERAKTMRGPQGPPGRAGPQGPQGQSVDPNVVSQTIDAKIKAMHGGELAKAKRMAEEAVKRASSQGKELERISGQELATATGGSATGASATGAGETGIDGLEEQRENAAERLNAAKLDAKAALTVAKAEGATGSDGENLDSIDGGEANKQAAAKIEGMKMKKVAASLAGTGGAGATQGATKGAISQGELLTCA